MCFLEWVRCGAAAVLGTSGSRERPRRPRGRARGRRASRMPNWEFPTGSSLYAFCWRVMMSRRGKTSSSRNKPAKRVKRAPPCNMIKRAWPIRCPAPSFRGCVLESLCGGARAAAGEARRRRRRGEARDPPSNPPALGLGGRRGHTRRPRELAGAVGEGATPCTDGRPSENTPAWIASHQSSLPNGTRPKDIHLENLERSTTNAKIWGNVGVAACAV